MQIKGRVWIELRNADGSLAQDIRAHNFITDAGEAHIADQLSDGGEAAMGWMAIGDSTGQSKSSTALANETARVALDATYPLQGSGADDNDVLYQGTFAAGTGTGTVSEVGVLNAVTAGTLLNYSDNFDAFTKGASQSAVITVTLTIGTG